MTDKNGDGRVDVITWSSGGMTDQKIDLDFDGRFDRWVVHRGQTVLDMSFKRGRLVGFVSERKVGGVVAKIRASKANGFKLELQNATYAYARGGVDVPSASPESSAQQDGPVCVNLNQRINRDAKALKEAIASDVEIEHGVDARCKISNDDVKVLGKRFENMNFACLEGAIQKVKDHSALAGGTSNGVERIGSKQLNFSTPDKEDFLNGFAFAQGLLLGECAGESKAGCPAKKREPVIKCVSLGKAASSGNKTPPLARMDPVAMKIELNLDRIHSDVPRPNIVQLVQHEYLHLAMVNLCREQKGKPYCEEKKQEALVGAMFEFVTSAEKCGYGVSAAIPAAEAERAQAQAVGGQGDRDKTVGAWIGQGVAGMAGARSGSTPSVLGGASFGATDGERETAAGPQAPSSIEAPVIERPVPQESEFRTIAPSIDNAASRLEGLTFGDTPPQLVMETTRRAATDVMDRVDRAWDQMAGYIKREALPLADAEEVMPRQARSSRSSGRETSAQTNAGTRESVPSRERNTNFDSEQATPEVTIADTGASAKAVKAQVAKAGLGGAPPGNVTEQIQNARENVNEGLALQNKTNQETAARAANANADSSGASANGATASAPGKSASSGGSGAVASSSGARAQTGSSGSASTRRAPAAINPNAGLIDPNDIKTAITSKTRLIVMAHAPNVLGTIQPIKEIGSIAREHDILFMVDAAQTAGVCEIDVNKYAIDMLAFTGHKGTLGPTGTGGLYVGERLTLDPWREGGTGFEPALLSQPEELPFKLESGTPNTVGIAGLRAGIEYIASAGIHTIRMHEQKLINKLIQRVAGRGVRDDREHEPARKKAPRALERPDHFVRINRSLRVIRSV